MKWLLVFVLNGIETPMYYYDTMEECSKAQRLNHYFFLKSNADLKEKQSRTYRCKAIERWPSSSH